jgi:hypothetical protein
MSGITSDDLYALHLASWQEGYWRATASEFEIEARVDIAQGCNDAAWSKSITAVQSKERAEAHKAEAQAILDRL